MHKMTRAGVQRNLVHHVSMAEYYYALHEAERVKKAKLEEASQQEETEQRKTTDEQQSSDEQSDEQAQDESEQESDQQAKVEEPQTENHKLLLLHTEVVKQLRDLLDSEPVTHAVNDARENVPRRNKGPIIHPTSPRLQ